MPANALVQARIDEAVKKEAATVLAEIGLTVSDAVRLMLTKVAREHALPFDVRTPNAKTKTAMRELETGKGKRFKDVKGLMDDLNADD
ncbi:MAG: type II toxin-antitoxin system RelB/DinJ family antitoxin [Thermodesulfobacteriota bacterium]